MIIQGALPTPSATVEALDFSMMYLNDGESIIEIGKETVATSIAGTGNKSIDVWVADTINGNLSVVAGVEVASANTASVPALGVNQVELCRVLITAATAAVFTVDELDFTGYGRTKTTP